MLNEKEFIVAIAGQHNENQNILIFKYCTRSRVWSKWLNIKLDTACHTGTATTLSIAVDAKACRLYVSYLDNGNKMDIFDSRSGKWMYCNLNVQRTKVYS